MEGAKPSTWEAIVRGLRGRLALAVVLAWVAAAFAYLGVLALGQRDALAVKYWTNPDWSGAPALERSEGRIHAERDDLKRLIGDSPGYSAVWSGVLYAARDGELVFTITSDDGSWVILDGTTLIDDGGRHGATTKAARVRLARGNHTIAVRYFDAGGLAVVDFSWEAPGFFARLLPPGVLYPAEPAGNRGARDWRLAVALVVLRGLLVALTIALLVVGLARLHIRRDAEAVAATLVFAVLLGVLAVKLAEKRSTSVTACDSYAYLQGAAAMSARGLLHDELHDPLIPQIVSGFRTRPADRDLAFFLSPHGHYVYDFEHGLSHNVFPPGMMWLLLPAFAGGGPAWALLVLPVLTPAVMLAFFLLARRHEGAWFGVCAAAFVIWNPVVFENTVLLMSDVPSMALTAASAYLMFLNLRRSRPLLPLGAGACFGLALTVRYSNAAAIVPVLVLFGLEWTRRRNVRELARDLVLFGAASTVFGILPLALFTHTQYGTLLRMTYDPYTASTMRLAHFLPNLAYYGRSVVYSFGVPGLVIVVIGTVAAFLRRDRRMLAITALLSVAAFLLPYAFERLREDRYLMPIYPWLALLYATGALAIGSTFRRWRVVRVGVIAVLAVVPLLSAWKRLPGGNFHRDITCRALAGRVERDAVVLCDDLSGPVRLYEGLTGYRFIWTRREVLAEACDVLVRLHRPVYFLLDCDAARDYFKMLQETGALRAANLTPAGNVDGLPLWRYGG